MKRISTLIFTALTLFLILLIYNTKHYNFQTLYSTYNDTSTCINTDLYNLQNQNTLLTNKQSEINKLEAIYTVILNSNKDYSEMSDSEKKIANELIQNWNKLSMDFKSQYIKPMKKLKSSINYYNSKKSSQLATEESRKIKASFNTGITYENINKTPEKYLGQKLTILGKTIQTTSDSSENYITIAVDDNMAQPLIIDYDPSIFELNLHPDSQIQIKGVFVGTISHLSLINGETKIPKIYANSIDIIK